LSLGVSLAEAGTSGAESGLPNVWPDFPLAEVLPTLPTVVTSFAIESKLWLVVEGIAGFFHRFHRQ
jgi:hypothetical protein